MMKLAEDYLPALANDPRVDAVVADTDALVLRMGGEILRVSPDAAHKRTAVWCEVRRLAAGETAAAAVAARRHNARHYETTSAVMGLYVEGHALILGQTLDGEEIGTVPLLDAAAQLRNALGGARELVEETLEEVRREASRRLPVFGDTPVIRA
jgi:hypothetical protein